MSTASIWAIRSLRASHFCSSGCKNSAQLPCITWLRRTHAGSKLAIVHAMNAMRTNMCTCTWATASVGARGWMWMWVHAFLCSTVHLLSTHTCFLHALHVGIKDVLHLTTSHKNTKKNRNDKDAVMPVEQSCQSAAPSRMRTSSHLDGHLPALPLAKVNVPKASPANEA